MKKIELAIFVVFALVLGILIYLVFTTNMKGVSCMADPLTYGILGIEKAYNSNLTCVCSLSDPKYSTLVVTSSGSIPLTEAAPFNIDNSNYKTIQTNNDS